MSASWASVHGSKGRIDRPLAVADVCYVGLGDAESGKHRRVECDAVEIVDGDPNSEAGDFAEGGVEARTGDGTSEAVEAGEQ